MKKYFFYIGLLVPFFGGLNSCKGGENEISSFFNDSESQNAIIGNNNVTDPVSLLKVDNHTYTILESEKEEILQMIKIRREVKWCIDMFKGNDIGALEFMKYRTLPPSLEILRNESEIVLQKVEEIVEEGDLYLLNDFKRMTREELQEFLERINVVWKRISNIRAYLKGWL